MYLKRLWLGLLTALMACLILSACGTDSSISPSGTPSSKGSDHDVPSEVTFGAILYNSGPGAAYGASQTRGLTLAQEELNAAGGVEGAKIQIVIEDDFGLSERALAAAQKLIVSNNVLAILGPTLSTNMFAAGPEANDMGVPIMGISTTVDGITDIGPFVFRNSLPDAGVIPATVAAAVERHDINKVSILYGHDNDSTVTGFNIFRRELADRGIEILSTQAFAQGQTNYDALLANVKAEQPDALVVSAFYSEGATIVRQAHQMGIVVPVLGGDGFNSPQYINNAGKAAENTYVGSPWYSGRNDERTQTFIRAYRDRFGLEPDLFAAQAYDGLYLFAEALKKNPPSTMTDRSAFRDALASIKNFKGVMGDFKFDENREPIATPTVYVVQNGQFQPLP